MNVVTPARRRRETRFHPKGRQVEARALAEIRQLLGDSPRRRDLLIEYLHRVQDRYGCLALRHLAALAEEMRLPMAEVYETASFYAHFDIVDDDQRPPPPLTVRVCESLSCALAGGPALLEAAAARLGPSVRVVPAPCMGLCDRAPGALVGQCPLGHADPEKIALVAAQGAVVPSPSRHQRLDAYRQAGGYRILGACRAGTRSRDSVMATLDEATLRGLGGAGFPTGRKWRLVAAQPGPRYLAVNADEGEPGTFKDRHYLETAPHRFLEGMLIAAWAVEARAVYIYLRDEYPQIRAILAAELAALAASGLDDGVTIELRRGAGAYICGEESAMLESLEGKRGLPRLKPPYPAEFGLFGQPTLVHNPETLHWVAEILERGADWFTAAGRHGRKGWRSFSVSGRVRSPGVKLAPAGITVRELIDEHCGGMAEGHVLKAYLPGGASGGILPARLDDVPLDFGTIEAHGGFIGSAAVIVLSQADSVRAAALNLMKFFREESCGQCTPCRIGTEKAVVLMEQPLWDAGLLEDLSTAMQDASICGLGQAAPNPLLAAMRYFPEEFPELGR